MAPPPHLAYFDDSRRYTPTTKPPTASRWPRFSPHLIQVGPKTNGITDIMAVFALFLLYMRLVAATLVETPHLTRTAHASFCTKGRTLTALPNFKLLSEVADVYDRKVLLNPPIN